jgi:hypothetical protein
MTLAATLGEYGDGKTLLLTCLAYLANYLQKDVYSNYDLKLHHYRLESLNDLDQVKQGICVFDEIWYSFDSRSANTKENRFGSVVLSKSRKRGIFICYSEQSFGLVDTRYRDRTNLIFLPELDNARNPKYLSVEVWKRNKFGEWQKSNRKLVFSVKNIINKYDTNEELVPLRLEN